VKVRFFHQSFDLLSRLALAALLLFSLSTDVRPRESTPQRRAKASKTTTTQKPTDLSKLRDEFVQATKDYKTSLTKLLAIYEKNVGAAEERLSQSQGLFNEGLISKRQVEDAETQLAEAKNKVLETQNQMTTADAQIANTLVEAEAESKLAKQLKRGSLVRTTSYIRYAGMSAWALSDTWRVQQFFLSTFKRPLPIAVFGQGAIHDRWRLDHRNSIDVSLHPNSVEGQALMNYLQTNGIPFLAFSGAIPGTATGPHIHIGRPSHRY
jgi:hypothetical protein